jgi:hypothetical protein
MNSYVRCSWSISVGYRTTRGGILRRFGGYTRHVGTARGSDQEQKYMWSPMTELSLLIILVVVDSLRVDNLNYLTITFYPTYRDNRPSLSHDVCKARAVMHSRVAINASHSASSSSLSSMILHSNSNRRCRRAWLVLLCQAGTAKAATGSPTSGTV